jgi:hypothetical protein
MAEQETAVAILDTEQHLPELTREERAFGLAQRQATALATSDLVPAAYQGNVANCLIAMNLAKRIGTDPLMVMQNLDVIHGKPSFRSTFMIACLNQSGIFSPLRYRFEGEGDDRTCFAYATEKSTGELIEGPKVSIAMAKAEGWYNRKGSKWKTMPDLMQSYRAAAFFVRTIAPELTMGLSTAEEMEDRSGSARDVTTQSSSAREKVLAEAERQRQDADAEQPQREEFNGPPGGDDEGGEEI